MRYSYSYIFILTLFLPFQALSWGQTGHRVVGQIADLHLSKKAKEQVKNLLGHVTLADSTTWADEVRSDPAYDSYKPWHYVSIEDSKPYSPKDDKMDVIKGIREMIDTVRGEIINSNIFLWNDEMLKLGYSFKDANTSNNSYKLSLHVLIHEIGHFLGLHHQFKKDVPSVMSYSSDNFVELQTYDIQAIQHLYPLISP